MAIEFEEEKAPDIIDIASSKKNNEMPAVPENVTKLGDTQNSGNAQSDKKSCILRNLASRRA